MSLQINTSDSLKEINFYTLKNSSKPNVIDSLHLSLITPPTDEYRGKRIVTEDELIYLNEAIEKTGIKNYSWSLLKDNHSAIKKSQTHLIDLIRYYEGDSYHYYEANSVAYKDRGGSKTIGFGEWLQGKNTATYTQKDAYKKLSEHLKEHANYVKNKVGSKSYNTMPQSIKEALIDLSFNKGPGQIGSKIKKAVAEKNWSEVIANIHCVKMKDGEKEEPGLYRRSLSRAILAVRDLNGNERKQSITEIEKLYNKALQNFIKNKQDLTELKQIYEYYKTGKISGEIRTVESSKIKIDNSFKGKGVFAVAQKAYNSLPNSQNIEFKDFYEEFKQINKNPESIVLGSELNVPYLKNIKQNTANIKSENINTKEIDSTKTINDTIQEKDKTVKEIKKSKKENIFIRAWKGIKNFFANLWNKIFGTKKNKEDIKENKVPKNSFEKVTFNSDTKIEKFGELNVYTLGHEIQKGETVWRLAKEYGLSEEALCQNNNIEDKTQIKAGEMLNIQKVGYEIKKGDNLFQISKKFGISIEMLKDLNNIEDVDQIKAGQIIEIPGFTHEIKKGETLYSISKKVGVPIDKLKSLNNITSTDIKAGSKLIILYDDADFAISNERKEIKIDNQTNTKTETINMAGEANFTNRPLLKKKRKINGKVAATREVFLPLRKGRLSGKTIILNAGHGYSQAGIDRGTLGRAGAEDEWLYNYDNAMRIKNKLTSQGAKVIFLQGHANIIMQELKKKENFADMLISVHVNSHDKLTQDRTQVYYSTKKGSKGTKLNKKSQTLAKLIEKNFDNTIPKIETINNKDKFYFEGKQDYAQAKGEPLGVCTSAEMHRKIPSVLWETAFMVSPKGRERLQNPKLMNEYADIMAKSVVEYFETI